MGSDPKDITLAQTIWVCLGVKPDQSAIDLVESLTAWGVHEDKTTVNSVLYRHADTYFVRQEGSPPTWRSKPSAKFDTPLPEPPASFRKPPDIPLYSWQRQALDAWSDAGHIGVIEAVTGTGKTRVGMVAIRNALIDGGCAHVLVPTIDLQEQWIREIHELFPGRRIGRRGNGHHATFANNDIVVSVVNSARDFETTSLPPNSILVADECHRYGADCNAKALADGFERRLGLTATFAREDDGSDRLLKPYFGETCFRMGYAQAIADEVTAHFKTAFVGVDFATVEERGQYERLDRYASRMRAALVDERWVAEEPFGEFLKDVAALAKNQPRRKGEGDREYAVERAQKYLKAFADKRKLVAETQSKFEALASLAPCIAEASRTIVFSETIDGAKKAVDRLRLRFVVASAIHSELGKDDRAEILEAFGQGKLRVITAPRVLDEGIDVPEADLAIVIAASKTRRQMIQRMGRVLRRKTDGRLARLVVLFVNDTMDAPESGAHETFIDEITFVAEEVQRFQSPRDAVDIVNFINDFEVAGGQPPPRMEGS